MKIYILADMEGISGIRNPQQVEPGGPEYLAEGIHLMMKDMNAAIDGAFAGGATEVVACDTHAGGGQVRVGDMDERAVYEQPAVGRMMPALDETFAGVILLGHHARAGTMNAFLDHTMSSASWFEYRLNDQVLGEIGMEAAWAGHYGVPVIMVSGDAAAAAEAREVLGDVETAVVKWGLGRQRARCLPLGKAHAVVRAAAQRAVQRAGHKQFKAFAPAVPATVRVTFYRSDMADEWVQQRGNAWQRVDARTVRRRIDSLLELYH